MPITRAHLLTGNHALCCLFYPRTILNRYRAMPRNHLIHIRRRNTYFFGNYSLPTSLICAVFV
nr:MAG TPA: hypothetical protein [Caudoviricetes sp.]